MDWSVYDIADRFTLHDAGFLLCELDPLPFCYKLPDNDPYLKERQTASILTNALIDDAKQGRLKVQNSEGEDATQIWRQEKNKIFAKGYFERWRVHRNDLTAWAESKGKRPAFLFDDARDQNSILPSDWPNHTTPEIELLKKAISEFWENHKPERPPKRDEIVTWLLANGDISKSRANAIDLIIRPPYAKKGGNKKLP
jgi:hypothetical protein